MVRDDEQKAFDRAWSYLNYNAGAKWAALLAAVGTGLLYIALLVLLWLYADLMVHHGQIPSFADLSRSERESFRDYWSGLDPAQQKQQLEDLGVTEPASRTLTESAASFDELPFTERMLIWRAYVHQVVRQRVGGTAGALVLPHYRELPPPVQEAFAQHWTSLPDRDRLLRDDLGFNQAALDVLTAANADPRRFPTDLQEMAWRASVFQILNGQTDNRADQQEAAALAQQLREATANDNVLPGGADPNALADRGFLSLVVRNDNQNNMLGPNASLWQRWNPYRLSGPILGLTAYWNPWMWRYRGAWSNFVYYLTGLLLLAVIVGVVRSGLMYLMKELAARASIEATLRLRRAVYHHTFRLGTLAFRALGPGEAVTIFTRHTEAVQDALYTWLAVLFLQPITFGLLLAFALIIHPLLAIAFLLFALLVYLLGSQVVGVVRRQGRTSANRAAEQLTLMRESLMLMRLVKVYLMELFNQARVERQLAHYSQAQLQRYRGESFSRVLLRALGLLATVLLLYVGGLIVLHGQLSVAAAIVLATSLISLYWPLQSWLDNRRFLRRGRESALVLFRFLDRPGEVGQVVGAEFLPPLARELEFDGVSLREPGSNRMLLQDVSLTIKAGQRVGLVGPDNLEKHALVYLLPRFLDPTAGEIRMDDHNLRWVTLDSLRAQIAVVLQHHLVFHDTVANNIGCGDPAYTLPQIIEAAKVAHAHHFIQKLPQGYETAIGELGHSLTISEQFRIALARAILRDPALLIIEEPETPLDSDSKALLDDTFARVLPGRTAIFLPHRISTIKSCDQIFLLHKGRLEAAGEHRDLLTQNPLYRHLHYIEFSEMADQV